jgi:hypothetical protein
MSENSTVSQRGRRGAEDIGFGGWERRRAANDAPNGRDKVS